MITKSTTIEFHRFGSEADSLAKGRAYIRTCGYQRAAEEIAVRIEPKELRRSLNRLRYGLTQSAEAIMAAKQVLAAEAGHFLAQPQVDATDGGGLHQIDIVTHASELRAFPFEALYANEAQTALTSADQGVILTRRIRADFSDAVAPWPEVPSVLFVHAQVDHDLKPSLIEEHRQALIEALAPWGDPDTLESKGLLVVREVRSVEDLVKARSCGHFSYIHVLAHGARVAEDDIEEHESEWGLRLGRSGSLAASPRDVADALRPQEEYPLVVTLAACDSGSPDRPELGNSSLVEALHRNGIAVSIASQFPLTMPGSVRLARVFYRRLLTGEDVRIALHAARVELREAARRADEREHDWLSVVGYVRVPPEGYAQHLRAFRLRVLLQILEATRKDAERLILKDPPARDVFVAIGGRLRVQIEQLQAEESALTGAQSKALRAECVGLLASANKSLAEVLFVQARCYPGDDGGLGSQSRAALESALRWYTQAYRHDLTQHWHGIQKLSLEMALTGQLADRSELLLVRRVAQNAVDDDPDEYWACGTLAEALLLESVEVGEAVLSDANAALGMLHERAAKNPKDKGFAGLSTRRQLERYVKWWTQPNGYFAGRQADLSTHAARLAQLL